MKLRDKMIKAISKHLKQSPVYEKCLAITLMDAEICADAALSVFEQLSPDADMVEAIEHILESALDIEYDENQDGESYGKIIGIEEASERVVKEWDQAITYLSEKSDADDARYKALFEELEKANHQIQSYQLSDPYTQGEYAMECAMLQRFEEFRQENASLRQQLAEAGKMISVDEIDENEKIEGFAILFGGNKIINIQKLPKPQYEDFLDTTRRLNYAYSALIRLNQPAPGKEAKDETL